MTVRVAINGFGRTGRCMLRAAVERDADLEASLCACHVESIDHAPRAGVLTGREVGHDQAVNPVAAHCAGRVGQWRSRLTGDDAHPHRVVHFRVGERGADIRSQSCADRGHSPNPRVGDVADNRCSNRSTYVRRWPGPRKLSRTASRARRPMPSACAPDPPKRPPRRRRSSARSRGSTSRPVAPWSICSRIPPTRLATTGSRLPHRLRHG